ncbi:hypothetical protein ACTA71_005185 [Dictyostelium dimigraforme]
MKFLSALLLLLSVLALVRGDSYNQFKVNVAGCNVTESLNDCTSVCGAGSIKISSSGSQYLYEQFATPDCSVLASLSAKFTCSADEAPVDVVTAISVVCETSASSQLTSAILFVVGLAFTMALLL